MIEELTLEEQLSFPGHFWAETGYISEFIALLDDDGNRSGHIKTNRNKCFFFTAATKEEVEEYIKSRGDKFIPYYL